MAVNNLGQQIVQANLLAEFLDLTLYQRKTNFIYLFIHFFAGPDSVSTPAGLTSEVKVAETSQVNQLIAKQKKRSGKWMLI